MKEAQRTGAVLHAVLSGPSRRGLFLINCLKTTACHHLPQGGEHGQGGEPSAVPRRCLWSRRAASAATPARAPPGGGAKPCPAGSSSPLGCPHARGPAQGPTRPAQRAEPALVQPGRATWGSPSTAHLVPNVLPYFSTRGRWQWEDDGEEQKQRRRLLQRAPCSAAGFRGVFVALAGRSFEAAQGSGGNSRQGEQRCGRSLPWFSNTTSQEQLPLAQHSLAARHKQKNRNNPCQMEAEPLQRPCRSSPGSTTSCPRGWGELGALPSEGLLHNTASRAARILPARELSAPPARAELATRQPAAPGPTRTGGKGRARSFLQPHSADGYTAAAAPLKLF